MTPLPAERYRAHHMQHSGGPQVAQPESHAHAFTPRSHAGDDPARPGGAPRRIGRPLEMTANEVLQAIRERAAGPGGLFRVHLEAPSLYARARRLFGSWSMAVRQAGVDYEALQSLARVRSLETRRRNRRDAGGAARRRMRNPG